jgi:hypothetical protein
VKKNITANDDVITVITTMMKATQMSANIAIRGVLIAMMVRGSIDIAAMRSREIVGKSMTEITVMKARTKLR